MLPLITLRSDCTPHAKQAPIGDNANSCETFSFLGIENIVLRKVYQYFNEETSDNEQMNFVSANKKYLTIATESTDTGSLKLSITVKADLISSIFTLMGYHSINKYQDGEGVLNGVWKLWENAKDKALTAVENAAGNVVIPEGGLKINGELTTSNDGPVITIKTSTTSAVETAVWLVNKLFTTQLNDETLSELLTEKFREYFK
jgi:hypothetical protein